METSIRCRRAPLGTRLLPKDSLRRAVEELQRIRRLDEDLKEEYLTNYSKYVAYCL